MSFWDRLPKPILALAPLANVTDAAFRRIIAQYSKHTRKDGTEGGPDIIWTEFVSADGLLLADEKGKKKLLADLVYTEEERPIVAQLFTSNEAHMERAAALCASLGFDGIDINMGCPDKAIERQGAGAALIKNPNTAAAIIRAAKRGAGALPVSVKTRVGYNKYELKEWLPALLAEAPAAITIHARTRKEMSKVPARWEHVREAVEMRDARGMPTRILGNGDILSLRDAETKAAETGADGVMVGRGIFGNPWFFNPGIGSISVLQRLQVMLEHTKLFEELLPFKSFAIMKKHYKAYVTDFDGAKELRMELMSAESSKDVERVVNSFLKGAPAL